MAKKKVIRKSKVTFDGELMFVSEYVGAPELKGKDVTVTIASVVKEQVAMTDGGKKTKLVIRFKESAKKLICNKTNGDSISVIHGNESKQWAGKRITLYPTTCLAFGEMVECIRVREVVPSANGKPSEQKPAETQAEREPGADDDGIGEPPPTGELFGNLDERGAAAR